jgi:hypothetical protein
VLQLEVGKLYKFDRDYATTNRFRAIYVEQWGATDYWTRRVDMLNDVFLCVELDVLDPLFLYKDRVVIFPYDQSILPYLQMIVT